MGRPSKYPPELRERAVRMVFEHAHEHRSQWATIRSVAEKLDCTTEALRRRVRQAERDEGKRPGLTTSERQRLKELEREKATGASYLIGASGEAGEVGSTVEWTIQIHKNRSVMDKVLGRNNLAADDALCTAINRLVQADSRNTDVSITRD